VDVQGRGKLGWWPGLLATKMGDRGCALLRRILAADRDSVVRCMKDGCSALHLAATLSCNTEPLTVLLNSGLSHFAKAVNAVALQPSMRRPPGRVTPLHCACNSANRDAALVLLAAGARVDIAGNVDGKPQTIAEWARSSSACRHRGVKLVISARAREHEAQQQPRRAPAPLLSAPLR
jgi:hypothetical protein